MIENFQTQPDISLRGQQLPCSAFSDPEKCKQKWLDNPPKTHAQEILEDIFPGENQEFIIFVMQVVPSAERRFPGS